MTLDEKLIESMQDLKDDCVYETVKELVASGETPMAVQRMLNEGMKKVGEIYETGRYFLGDLIFSGVIYETVLSMPEMHFSPDSNLSSKGKVLLGTVEGDLHDLGKSILLSTLAVNGFSVKDIGIDVSSDNFVDGVRDFKPDIVALSGVLSTSLNAISQTVQALKAAGLRDGIFIIVGGNSTCRFPNILNNIGADAYGSDALEGLQLCEKFIAEKYNGQK